MCDKFVVARTKRVHEPPRILPVVRVAGTASKSYRSPALPISLLSRAMKAAQFVTYGSDKHGFNNRQNLWDATPIDIAVVGEFFLQLRCTPPERNFVALIREQYPATLNLGGEGNGPLFIL